MAFRSSVVPFPPTQLDPGSCQAVRIAAIFEKPAVRVPVTPEWIAENQLKQLRYERERAAWRKKVGVINTK